MGKDIEEFVRSRKVGADAWRRTGVLTFDGNSRTGPKVTYKRIQQHLEKKYHCKFGYGTIVQMCVARNIDIREWPELPVAERGRVSR